MLSDKELEIIRRKMAELEEDPPAGAWHKIQADLKPARNYRPWWWVAAACLFLGLVTLVGWPVSDPQTRQASVNKAGKKEHPGGNEIAATPERAREQESHPAQGYQEISGRRKEVLVRESGWVDSEASPPSGQEVKRIKVPPGSKENSKIKRSGRTEPEKEVRRQQVDRRNPGKFVRAGRSENPSPIDLQTQTAIAAASPGIKPDYLAKGDSLQTGIKWDSLAAKPVFAASDSSSREEGKGWSLGLLIAPRYASKVFVPDAADNIFITRLNNKNKFNAERQGIELGLQVSRAISPKLDLNLGVSWLKAKENVSYTYSNGTFDSVQYIQVSSTSMVVKPIEKQETGAFISASSYGGAQLGMSYHLWSGPAGKLSVSLSGGGNVLLKSKTRFMINGDLYPALSAQEEDSLMNKSNFNLALGLGYTRELSKGFDIRVMPTLSYFLEPVYKPQQPYSLRPYFLNLNIVLIRRFKRE